MINRFVNWTRKFVDLRGPSAIMAESLKLGECTIEFTRENMTKPKLCAHCQYFREPNLKASIPTAEYWCSNSKSTFSLIYVYKTNTCPAFSKRGKKAPLWMRLLNKVMR